MSYKFTKKSREALFYFLKQQPKMMIGVIMLSVALCLSEVFSVGILYPLLTEMVDPGQGTAKYGKNLSFLFEVAGSIQTISPLHSTLAIFTIGIIAKNIFGYFREVYSTFMGLAIREHCQEVLFQRLLKAKYSYFLRQRLGDLEYRVITAPNQLSNFVAIIPNIFTSVLSVCLLVGLLLSIAPEATLLIIILGVIFFATIRYLATRVSYRTGKERANASSDITVFCGQVLQGIKTVKIFKAENFWKTLFSDSVKRYYSFARIDTIFLYMPSRLMEIIVFSMLALIIGTLSAWYGMDSMKDMIPVFGVFVFALQRLLPAFFAIGKGSMRFMSLLPYGEASFEALSESNIDADDSGHLPCRFENEITIRDVSLVFENSNIPALNKISCTIKKNHFIGIVGESGSGKTSILNLILKILEPTEGQITVDGVPLKDIKTGDWYDNIGYVGQEIFLFHGTIRENILFGMENVSDDKIYEVLKMANAMEFVQKTEKGLDTIVGDRGEKLSGGERQRIALARTLLRKPMILILDEATSAVDNISEKLIRETIKNLHNQMTIINVAHRLSTIIDADHIIVLKNGRIAETGNYDDLLKNGGSFKELYQVKQETVKV